MNTALQLRHAIVAMTIRYGEACQQNAYASTGAEMEHWNRMAGWRFAAVQRLTRALADMAGGVR